MEGSYPCIWAIGSLDILNTRLIGFFCSTKCPGNVIIHIYDLARALRDSGISVISGFHAPMEKECLDLLLRGRQPVVLCPARNIEQMRHPTAWRAPIAEGRMLVLSPFGAPHHRATADLAEQRNCFVSLWLALSSLPMRTLVAKPIGCTRGWWLWANGSIRSTSPRMPA